MKHTLLIITALMLFVGCSSDKETPSSQAQVDRTDAKSTAGAMLRAYKAKDLRTLATLATKSDHDFLIEMADSGESHRRYRDFMEVNFRDGDGKVCWRGTAK